MFFSRFPLKKICPIFLNAVRKISCYQIKHHQLIGLSGKNVTEFLQGIISNDIRILDWRILTDSFVYRIEPTQYSQSPLYLIEVDASLNESVLNLLNMYNFRKKVTIWNEEEINVWIAIPSTDSTLTEIPKFNSSVLFYAFDPRAVPGWSGRILVNNHFDARKAFGESYVSTMTDHELNSIYTHSRYELGIPEGPAELKTGIGFPLESNADICGGVSFTKGCYVGQELTTRSNFTGVIRKRIVPIVLANAIESSRITPDAPIYHLNGANERKSQRPVGWIRGIEDARGPHQRNQHQMGISLLRLSDAIEAVNSGQLLWASFSGLLPENHLPIDPTLGVFIHPYAPEWWPENVAVGLPRLSITAKRSSN